jgi:ATP-binding cassette subfamily G (WHITE) protein 2
LYTNPADHLLDVITPPKTNQVLGGNTISLEQQAAIDAALISAQSPLHIDLNMGVNKRLIQMNNAPLHPTWIKQVHILLQRNFQEQFRQSKIIIISVIQTILMAVLIGTAFLNIGTTQQSIVRREPVIFFCAVNQGVFGALMVINSFPVERALTLRERASGTYFASAYFTAKIIADTLVQVPVPIIFVRKLELSVKISIFLLFIVMHCLFSRWFTRNSWKIFYFYAIYAFMFNRVNIFSSNGFCSL